MSQSIAFFDFDGTLTTKDTMIELVRYKVGTPALISGLLRLSPYIAGYKLGIIKRKKAKEKFLTHFFSGISIENFDSLCRNFTTYVLPKLILPIAYKKILWHKEKRHQVTVVTASAEAWVKHWCNAHEIDCIGTRLETKNNILTGKIDGENCYGEEKVTRIKKLYNIHEFNEIYVYGDSNGDKQMMKIGTKSFFKTF